MITGIKEYIGKVLVSGGDPTSDNTLVYSSRMLSENLIELIDDKQPEKNFEIISARAEKYGVSEIFTETLLQFTMPVTLRKTSGNGTVHLFFNTIVEDQEFQGQINLTPDLHFTDGKVVITTIGGGGGGNFVPYDKVISISEEEQMNARRTQGLYSKYTDKVAQKFEWDGNHEGLEGVETLEGFFYYKVADYRRKYRAPIFIDGVMLTDTQLIVAGDEYISAFPANPYAEVIFNSVDAPYPCTYNNTNFNQVILSRGIWVKDRVKPITVEMTMEAVIVNKVPEEFLPDMHSHIINVYSEVEVEGYIVPSLSPEQVKDAFSLFMSGTPVTVLSFGQDGFVVTGVKLDGKDSCITGIYKNTLLLNYILRENFTVDIVVTKLNSEGPGSDDYETLRHLPQINSVTLIGNKTLEDIGVEEATNEEIDNLFV